MFLKRRCDVTFGPLLLLFLVLIASSCSQTNEVPDEMDGEAMEQPGENEEENEQEEDEGNDAEEDTEEDMGDGMGDDSDTGMFGLNPSFEPWENFDLSSWVIDTPAFDVEDGFSERYGELDWEVLASSASRPFFFTHTDGGMRFVSTVGGAKTSQNTSFPRSELREMLRRGDRSISTQGPNGNNWALGYQPGNTGHGGRNGVLAATLRVNQVTTTGSGLHPGRVIIGQIHADNDEPARLYYRKLPDAEFGCIYLEHEIRDGDDVTFNLIGDEDCEGNGPEEGIQLDELFSYEIVNIQEDIIVRIRRGDSDGPIIAQVLVDMESEASGYDRSDEWMYFKAGAYTQNNTGEDDDSDIVTFYRLSNTHDTN